MGVYRYKISRKSRAVKGARSKFGNRVYTAEFAYKSTGYNDMEDRLYTRFVQPTADAWKREFNELGATPDDILFVMDWRDGEPVYRRHTVSFFDGDPVGRVYGTLRSDGSNRFRVEVAENKLYEVTFRGSEEHATYRVLATCEYGAKLAAGMMRADSSPNINDPNPMVAEVVDEAAALKMAIAALRRDRNESLSKRVDAIHVLKEHLRAHRRTGLVELGRIAS